MRARAPRGTGAPGVGGIVVEMNQLFNFSIYPTRSRAAYPPPRWVFSYLLIDCGQKVLIFNGQGTEKIDFGIPGTENIDFWCSGERNIDFWCPGKENFDFWCSRERNIDFLVSGNRKY